MMRNRMIMDKLLGRGVRWRSVVMLKPPPIKNSSSSILNPSRLSFTKQPALLFPCLGHRFLSSKEDHHHHHQDQVQYDEETDGWEEEDDEVDPQIGDGGDGGGVALQGCSWGERALSIAHEVLGLLPRADDIKLFAFKTTPRGYVYVRLDKLSHKYGCPSIEELEKYSQEYKKRLDEVGALGLIPDDLALEVSTPGAERILKVPDDLSRFRDMPMRVCYCYVDEESDCTEEKDGVFLLESVEADSGICVWKLADVRENRDVHSKGRPLSRKKKDWRLNLPFGMHRMVTLYLDC